MLRAVGVEDAVARVGGLTFASDEALAPLHDLRLLLEADGTWSVQPMQAGTRTT